jgi:hypothetical protein
VVRRSRRSRRPGVGGDTRRLVVGEHTLLVAAAVHNHPAVAEVYIRPVAEAYSHPAAVVARSPLAAVVVRTRRPAVVEEERILPEALCNPP